MNLGGSEGGALLGVILAPLGQPDKRVRQAHAHPLWKAVRTRHSAEDSQNKTVSTRQSEKDSQHKTVSTRQSAQDSQHADLGVGGDVARETLDDHVQRRDSQNTAARDDTRQSWLTQDSQG